MRSLQACLDSIPYAVWLGVTAEPDGVLRMRLVGDERHLGNPILSAWHGGVLAGSLQVAMSAALMAANDLDEAKISLPSCGRTHFRNAPSITR